MDARTGAGASVALCEGDDLAELRVPGRGCYDEAAREARLDWLRLRTGSALTELGEMRLAAGRLRGNIENAIGAVELPVGLAGPLLFAGDCARGVIFAPLATTEGTLVASAARGATAITRAGGVRTRVVAQRMTRAPAFEFASVCEAMSFGGWIADQLGRLRELTGEVSRHAELRTVEPIVAGNVAHVVFGYTTGDAAGQNMTTATTWHACQWILAQLGKNGCAPLRFLIEGNASSDKKVSLMVPGGGRGCATVAECNVDGATLARTLKVTAKELLGAWTIVEAGARRVEMVTRNVNIANIIAAMFAATGQDIACVHESSLGTLELLPSGDGIGARLSLHGLAVGTVGGGTGLPAQRALLEMMGCTGDGSVRRLAEIIAGYCLALELSTLAAIATGEFASAHERLGRNRPERALTEEELVPSFFHRGVRRVLGASARVNGVDVIESEAGASILGELAARRFARSIGVFHRRLRLEHGGADVVVKIKPLDSEVELMMQGLAISCGPEVAAAWRRFGGDAGFRDCHRRELAIYAQADPRFVRHAPLVYDIVCDDARGIHALVLERLHGTVRLMDSADDPSGWRDADIEAALRGAGALHALWLGRERELLDHPWIGDVPTAARMTAMRPLWTALAMHAASEFPALMSERELVQHQRMLAAMPEWWGRMERMPRTLVHNDFNPRNLALRDANGASTLCAYDWELATLHLPQHDVAELLAFVLSAEATREQVAHLVELHRRAVVDAGGGTAVPDAATWRQGFALAARDLLVNRMSVYLMGHTQRQYAFLPRTLRTLRHLIALDLEAV
jgi:hydroxymethylglutaryl-CoA reductase (NADPH)